MLINVNFDSYNKAFIVSAILAGISGGLLLEYHKRDPLKLYLAETKLQHKLRNIAITLTAAVLTAYLALWIGRLLFGYGDSELVL